jgi:hypothetical protein
MGAEREREGGMMDVQFISHSPPPQPKINLVSHLTPTPFCHPHSHLLQHRLQSGVQCLLHVLHQHRVAYPDRVLQRAQEAAVGELDDAEAVAGLHVLHPGVGLRE